MLEMAYDRQREKTFGFSFFPQKVKHANSDSSVIRVVFESDNGKYFCVNISSIHKRTKDGGYVIQVQERDIFYAWLMFWDYKQEGNEDSEKDKQLSPVYNLNSKIS
jgi:hypothetical protein